MLEQSEIALELAALVPQQLLATGRQVQLVESQRVFVLQLADLPLLLVNELLQLSNFLRSAPVEAGALRLLDYNLNLEFYRKVNLPDRLNPCRLLAQFVITRHSEA